MCSLSEMDPGHTWNVRGAIDPGVDHTCLTEADATRLWGDLISIEENPDNMHLTCVQRNAQGVVTGWRVDFFDGSLGYSWPLNHMER